MARNSIQAPPADFGVQLNRALRTIRVGDYQRAASILEPLRPYLPTAPVNLAVMPDEVDYYRLRLGTLLAEVADYAGQYDQAREVLEPYEQIVDELEALHGLGERLEFSDSRDAGRLVLRQKLVFLWQRSVSLYRVGDVSQSRKLLNTAILLAERLVPRPEALLAQLYYGAGKIALRECREAEAMEMYKKSLTSASARFEIARRETVKDREDSTRNEAEVARYSIAKTLALGVAQCLREQGRLEEAHSQAVAGRLLLSLGAYTELSFYVEVLLSSIARSIAGEQRPDLLDSAALQIEECVEYFRHHKGEVGYRSRLELALCRMQQGRLDEARQRLEEILESEPNTRWAAECNLALSRVTRRADRHDAAVEYARKAVNAAKEDGLERVKRRAQVVLVLALYDQAMASGGDEELLKKAMKEIQRAMDPESVPDVRTRANMLLTEARVLNVSNQFASALEAYRKYKALEPLVAVGRIKQLADIVEEELTANCLPRLGRPRG